MRTEAISSPLPSTCFRTTSSVAITRLISLSKVVVSAGDASAERAGALASRLGLALVAEENASGYRLIFVDQMLQLQKCGSRMGGIYVDFVNGKVGHRFRYGGGKGQLIAKAVGLKKGAPPSVLDLTAGLGRDAFVLASLGCQMTLLERSPIVAALLQDGLERAKSESEIAEIAEVIGRMTLVEAEALEYLQGGDSQPRPEVCYLDPMYPHSKKSALPGKEMLLFRELVGEDLDATELLAKARQVATKRVVVKRPRKAAVLADEEPDFQMSGKSTRYDIYLSLSHQVRRE